MQLAKFSLCAVAHMEKFSATSTNDDGKSNFSTEVLTENGKATISKVREDSSDLRRIWITMASIVRTASSKE